MKFYERETLFQTFRRRNAKINQLEDFYSSQIKIHEQAGDRAGAQQCEVEFHWSMARRPYYSVWPAIVPMLTSLNMNVTSSLIKLPLSELLVRLPVDNNPLTFVQNGCKYSIRSILAARRPVFGAADRPDTTPGLSIWIDFGEQYHEQSIPIFTYLTMRLVEDLTLEQALDFEHFPPDESYTVGIPFPVQLRKECVRLVCTLGLIADDPELIRPEVLSDDRSKFDRTGDRKFVEKAIRRGKYGWAVGESIEQCPHYRRPHLAWRWTGAGGLVPKIVPVKGAIVNRKKVGEVPTGYLDDEVSV